MFLRKFGKRKLSALAYPDNPLTKCPIFIHVGGPFLCYMCSYEKQSRIRWIIFCVWAQTTTHELSNWQWICLRPLHMSPVIWAGSVSEISLPHSCLRKSFDVFIWEAGLVRLPRSRFLRPNLGNRDENSPIWTLQPGDRTKLFNQNRFAFAT